MYVAYVCRGVCVYVCFINRLLYFLTKRREKCTEYRRWPGTCPYLQMGKNRQVFSPNIAKNGPVASILAGC